MADNSIASFIQSFTAWASASADVQAALLIGSHARGAGSTLPRARPDSDIDLVLLTTQPARYLNDLAWTDLFGAVSRYGMEDYGVVTSVRVWYTDGREVEYGITTPAWVALPLDAGTHRVLEDGARVLFERGALVSGVMP